MTKQVIITIVGTQLDVTANGRDPLPMDEYKPLLPALTYRYRKQLFGADVIVDIDPHTGKKTFTRTIFEYRRLYRFDDYGNLIARTGFTNRIKEHFEARGYKVAVHNRTPFKSVETYRPCWDNLWKLDGRPFTATPEDVAAFEAALKRGDKPDTTLARRVTQSEMLAAFDDAVKARHGGVVVSPPGTGKSYVFAAICLLYRHAKIAVVLPDRDNFLKTARHLSGFMGGVEMQGAAQHASGRARVTVYMAQSLHHIPDDTDLILFDEVHTAAAPKTAVALSKAAPDALRFAFGATPGGRLDNADIVMEGLFGTEIYRISYQEAERYNLVIPILVRWIRCQWGENPLNELEEWQQKNLIWRKRIGIWRHERRHEEIAWFARRHEEDQVLILAATIEHALGIKKYLPEYTLVYGQQDDDYFQRYTAKSRGQKRDMLPEGFVPMSSRAREHARLDFESGKLRKVISTPVWSIGVSFNSLSVLFRTDAGASPIMDTQVPCRANRHDLGTAKTYGLIYDLDDGWDPEGFGKRAPDRRRNYKANGWSQTYVTRGKNGFA